MGVGRLAGSIVEPLMKGIRNRPSLHAGVQAVRPGSWGGAAMEVAPDLLGSIALANSMQGAQGGEQYGASGLDLATSLALSFGSRALGGAAMNKIGRLRGVDPEVLANMTHQGANMAGFAGPMGAYMAIGTENMNPIYRSYLDRLGEEQRRMQEERERGLVSQALGGLENSPHLMGLDNMLGGGYG